MAVDADEFRTPGHLIRSLLKSRGWSQRTLAVILDIGEASITRLIAGTRPVDAELAIVLEDVLGAPAEQFLALQTGLDLGRVRTAARPDPARALRARLYGEFPVAEMIARGWLDAADMRDRRTVESELVRFFGVDRVDDIADAPCDGTAPAQRAWLRGARQVGGAMDVAPYTPHGLRQALPELRAAMASLGGLAAVPAVLAGCGVRLAVVETLADSEIDGACLWLGEFAPAIALTLRDDRIDQVWEALRHALEHVLRGQEGACIAGDPACHAAREAARAFGVPAAALEAFLARKAPFVCERDMVAFARELGIHPGILAARMVRSNATFDRFSAHRVPVRAILCRHAVTDGWGRVAFSSAAGAARRLPRREPAPANVQA